MRLETLFIIIFIVFGVGFIFITPPGWNTDELDHTYRIHQLSTGNLLSEEVRAPNGLRAFGGDVPTNLVRLYNETGANVPGAVSDTNKKVNGRHQTKPDMYTLRDDGSRRSTNFSGAALYSPVAYAMYVPVFWLGQLLSLPFFHTIIIARLIGLVLTGLALFLAIKHIPIGKWVIFSVGLLPVVVAQAASVGADAPQIAISVLFIALILRQLYLARKPTSLEYTIMTVLGAALVLVKLVYTPLVLLMLVLPIVKKECRNRKQLLLIALAVLITIIPGFIWTQLVGYIDINSNPQANFGLQKVYILHEPIMYLKTLYYTFFTNEQVALGHIFGDFVWASAPLPAIYAYIASAAILASLVVRSGREVNVGMVRNKDRIWRIALAMVSGMVGVLIATALYIYSTTLHQSSIVGIRARYFIPILPAVLLVFYGNIIKNQRVVKVGIVVMSCLVLIGAILTVYHRLYQTLPVILQ